MIQQLQHQSVNLLLIYLTEDKIETEILLILEILIKIAVDLPSIQKVWTTDSDNTYRIIYKPYLSNLKNKKVVISAKDHLWCVRDGVIKKIHLHENIKLS